MLILLLRHAEAESFAISDERRKLTEKGRVQARRIGEFCRRHELVPDRILSSTYVRAWQTAELVAEECGGARPAREAFLGSGMEPETALAQLPCFGASERLMLVGHEPDFSRLAALLIGLPPAQNLRFRKGSIAVIRLEKIAPAAGCLELLVAPKFV